jgi:hypothetical protein
LRSRQTHAFLVKTIVSETMYILLVLCIVEMHGRAMGGSNHYCASIGCEKRKGKDLTL